MKFTIDSDDEIEPETDEYVTSEDDTAKPKASKKSSKKASGASKKKKTTGFVFDFDDGETAYSTKNERTESEDEDEESSEDEEEDEDGHVDNVRMMPRTEERIARAVVKASKKKKTEPEEDDDNEESDGRGMSAEMEASYFDSVVDSTKGGAAGAGVTMFSQLNLSRSFLRAIESLGYTAPTPIQAQVIPYALAGRDICASAVTGSGKTAAFVLPFLERLLHRSKSEANIHVLVITPTRELATQIHSVLQKLAQFTDITCALILGGKKDTKSQEAVLRNRPDVVICTPGRMLDHLRNSHSVSIDNLAVLVLDEVDRLLDLGFQAEVEELVKFCPESRQTMLFSATMTPKVEDLAKLSLKRPIRIKTASSTTTLAPRLIQEFIKVRKEDEVEAILLALICRSFGKKTIVFFDMKSGAHRFTALLGLMGVKASELHGNLQQTQRDLALQRFREGLVDVMVCTDIAARGLDIPGVQCVINAEMTRNASTYVHRVGRTARAGNGGRAITLVSDNRRKVMKDVLKGEGAALSAEGGQVLSRTVPAPVLSFYQKKIADLEGDISRFMKEERVRLQLEQMQRDTEHAENLLLHADEIAARPARTWYQSENQKKAVKEASTARAKEEQEEARLGRAEAARARTAAEKAAALARSDNYLLDEKQASKEHRLSRKKRRRLEALKAEGTTPEDTAREEREFTLLSKKAKVAQREKDKEAKERSLSEYGSKGGKITIQQFRDLDGDDDGDDSSNHNKRQKLVKETTKVVRQKIAVGGLDQDMIEWGGGGAGGGSSGGLSKKQIKNLAKEKEFTEFDANKRLRKGGKLGKSSFKSKAKFKRRK